MNMRNSIDEKCKVAKAKLEAEVEAEEDKPPWKVELLKIQKELKNLQGDMQKSKDMKGLDL